MKDRELALKRVRGCFMGVAIGDALGMPVETMDHASIMKMTGGRGIVGFTDPLARREWQKDLKAGDTTDDWQLTAVVAKSLARTKGILDIEDCSSEHVKALNNSTFGWGKGTENAIRDIRDGKRKPRDPLPPPGPREGCGNGVIMKIAPIAVSEFLRRPVKDPAGELAPWLEDLWSTCYLLGGLTHPDPNASLAAYAVAKSLVCILRNPVRNKADGDSLFEEVSSAIQEIEFMDQEGMTGEVRKYYVYGRLMQIPGNLGSAADLSRTVGCRFHALETVAFTIGTFLRHPTDFREGVLEAVNAGGDTDTNASVVGALIGANVGIDGIPQEWMNPNGDYKYWETNHLAKELFEAIVPQE